MLICPRTAQQIECRDHKRSPDLLVHCLLLVRCPATHLPIDDFAYLTAEIREAHLAHLFSFEDCIGEAVHAGRGPFTEPTNLVGWQAETHIDADFAEELFDRITWTVTEHALAVVTGEVSAGKTVAEAGAR